MPDNPFFHGNPVAPDQFVGRRRELRRIANRIRNQGQSTALVGDPRTGKSSLLHYLADPETRAALYGEDSDQFVFAYLDVHTLGDEFCLSQFWEFAFQPLYERAIAPLANPPLAAAYQACRDNHFGPFVVEKLLAQMRQHGWRLILLIDEFDLLLHHPILNSAEFFGGLRGIASRSRGALAAVIASRQSLSALNDTTQQFSLTSSPYFNFLDEITLGPLTNKDAADLLHRAGDRFNTLDQGFLQRIAGNHPYLLQVAAAALWDAYEDELEEPDERYRQTGQKLFDQAGLTLGDIWRLWSPFKRRAIAAIALAHIDKHHRNLLGKRSFKMDKLVDDLRDFSPEMRPLEKQGFIAPDPAVTGGYRIGPLVILWWLGDEIIRTVRRDPSLEEWLIKQELDGQLTRGQKQQLVKAWNIVGQGLKKGAPILIKAATE